MNIINNFRMILKNIIVNRLLVNVHNTNFDKHVLISYIVKPFYNRKLISHSNIQETLAIAEIFKNNKYNVDVVDYRNMKKINYCKYDYIFGFGEPFENSFNDNKFRGKRICYATGSHYIFQNTNTIRRLKQFQDQTGILLVKSGRFTKDWPLQWAFSDKLILIGNKFIEETFTPYTNIHIDCVPVTFIKSTDAERIILDKCFSEARKNYLWFNGSGAIHKGLDLLVDVFRDNTQYNLHVCGLNDTEYEFSQYLDNVKTKNIFNYGFIRIDSSLFTDLLAKCAFSILPSCSEGANSSIISLMANGGLIPLISPQCGISKTEFNIFIDQNLDQYSIIQAINESQTFDDNELREMSICAYQHTVKCNSIYQFKEKFKEAIFN